MSKVNNLITLYNSFITMKLGGMLPDYLNTTQAARYTISDALGDIVVDTRVALENLLEDTVTPDENDLDDARLFTGCKALSLETVSWSSLAPLLFLTALHNYYMELVSQLSVRELNNTLDMEVIKHILEIGYSL